MIIRLVQLFLSARFMYGDFVVVVVVVLTLLTNLQNEGNFTVALEMFNTFGKLIA